MVPNDWETGGWTDDEESGDAEDSGDAEEKKADDSEESEFSVDTNFDDDSDDAEVAVDADADVGGDGSDDTDFELDTEIDVEADDDDSDFSVASELDADTSGEPDDGERAPTGGGADIPDFGSGESNSKTTDEPSFGSDDVSDSPTDTPGGADTVEDDATPSSPQSGDVPDFGGTDGAVDATETSTSAESPPEMKGTDGSLDVGTSDTPFDGSVEGSSSEAKTSAGTTTESRDTHGAPGGVAGFGDVPTDEGELASRGSETPTESDAQFGEDFGESEEDFGPKFFSPQGIALATLLGGPLAAVGLLVYNCKQAGLNDQLSRVAAGGLAATFLAFGLVIAAPSSFLPVAGISIGGGMYYAKRLQSKIATRLDAPPRTYSDLGAAGAGCLFFFVSMAFFCVAGIATA